MNDAGSKTKCPDCGDSLGPIKVITVPVPRLTGEYQHDLRYSVAEAPSFWTSKFPVEGRIESMLCGGCGRVYFYARAD